MANWDDNDWESVSEENLRYFYEEFSSGVRKQLLSKNLLVPQNVYDVLYPRTKEALLAKNVVTITDLEENSKSIRDALISKLVSQNLDLDKISEDTRKSLLARNKILQNANDLLNNSYSARKQLLSKNISNDSDLLKESNEIRINNISKNTENINFENNNSRNNESYRLNNVSKNIITKKDLKEDSADFRDNNVSKNTIEGNSGLDLKSESFRDNNVSKNKNTNPQDIDSIGDAQRKINMSKNGSIDDSIDKLLEDSDVLRKNNISNNTPSIIDIDANSEVFRKNNLSHNVSSEADLEKDSTAIRRNNESSNIENDIDLESYSNTFRDNNLAPNVESNSDLEKDSEEIRIKNISSNNIDQTSLEEMSIIFRKNNVSHNDKEKSNLENDSEEFRKNNISANKSDDGDLLDDSSIFLKNNISNNTSNDADLLIDSESFLKNNTSSNVPNNDDLLTDSKTFFQNNTSANVPDNGDLLTDSEIIRINNISSNTSNNGDLLTDSESFLQNNISQNVPDNGDLLIDSEPFLQNNTSANVPDNGDLLIDSEPFLQNNTSVNVPDNGDLLIDSEPFLQNNTSANVPDSGDLLIDSEPIRNNNIASNVPDNGDLLIDSESFLQNNTSANVPDNGDLLTDSGPIRNNNIASNVPNTGDLLADSESFLDNNTSVNVPNSGDLLIDSASIRDNLVSANVFSTTDLEVFSKPFRDNNLSANPPIDPFGVNIEGIGTSTFIGVSKVLAQGLIIRQILKSKNKPSKYNIDNFISSFSLDNMSAADEKNLLMSKNHFQIGNSEYSQFNANLVLGNTPSIQGGIVRDSIQMQLDKNAFYSRSTALNLQNKYGVNVSNSVSPASVGGGFYSLDSVSPKGGFFDSHNAPAKVNFDIRYGKGSITDAIRNYNLSRNLYNLYRLTPGDLQSLNVLQQNTDEGFQDLIAKTIGHFSGNDSIGSQLQGNLVPRGILVSNEGAYIKGGSPENLLRPQQAQGMIIGSPESMMGKTAIGNPLNDIEFQAGTKGVRHIMKTIRNSDASKFSINYDVQNSRKYIIGVNTDGSPKVARQRFTVSNPYKPANAKKLVFSLKNYSSGAEFYFPPYIQSYSDSYGANWNSINFLGRPEPVFTYNNSTRDGTISFMILTDYSQNLVIGRDFNQDSLTDIKINPTIHFTSKDTAQNQKRELAINESEAKQAETNNTKQEYIKYNNIVSGGTPESNVLQQDINSLEKQANAIQRTQEDAFVSSNRGNSYSETNNVIGNVNDFMTSFPGREAGDIDTKAEDSKKRIDQMIQNLAFQPAFFSGDKIDFATKMDFLAKLTRPATADQGSGFSFTRPPVCHIHLGDWWNNDIVIDSVSFNYDDSPWTLDDGKTQPMWATVTMNFKFIGPYRGQSGPPVLSDDKGGFYWDRGTNPNNNSIQH